MSPFPALRFLAVALVLRPLLAVEAPDPAVTAAQRALDAGQPVAALQVLGGHAARRQPGDACLLAARASLALGRADETLDALAVRTADDLARWPERLRGAVAAVTGEAALAEGRIQDARVWLELALRLRGAAVETDRVLILLAEVCERLADVRTAERAAYLVWRDWPRSPYRARAGLLVARQWSASRPDEARALLAGVRALDHSEPAVRLAAAELLCHLLLAAKPGQCLVVAEQEDARLPTTGRLPLYRALALGALEPREGLVALDALPVPLRDDPAAVAARTRWSASSGPVQDVALRLEHARAQIDLGRHGQARALLEPLAASHPAALVLLVQIPGVAPDPWLAAPTMQDPVVRATVAMVLAGRGDHMRAWPLFATMVDSPVPDGVAAASVWFWAARAATQMAPARVPELTARIMALDGEGTEIGVTWAEEAQRRERSARPAEDIAQAWRRAGAALPSSHPWQPVAIQRAARHLMQGDGRWEEARRLLERVSATGGSDDHLRCRFLLLQVYERLGMTAQALDLVRDLLPSANPEQAEKLERIRARLALRAATEVQPGPLDAEN
jgi:tetratricopeptide (TPR) repeat protein